jgi:Flp pilus assembly protein CpaB
VLTIRWGFVRRRTNRIPRSKITNVDLALNYLVPGMSGVKVNVGSGEPIVCRGLTRRSAKALAAALHHQPEAVSTAASSPA